MESVAAPEPPNVAGPPLQLGTVLTPQQRSGYVRALDQSLAHAAADLALLKGKALNSDQTAALGRIASFINQARENRDADPALAARLAERAELLARDLVGSVR
ncbi:MAG: hypothetical protein NTY38_31625 [Acidobacteria bacterium]|nr:hypothetical protein [Acidobacteriota bacterium]